MRVFGIEEGMKGRGSDEFHTTGELVRPGLYKGVRIVW